MSQAFKLINLKMFTKKCLAVCPTVLGTRKRKKRNGNCKAFLLHANAIKNDDNNNNDSGNMYSKCCWNWFSYCIYFTLSKIINAKNTNLRIPIVYSQLCLIISVLQKSQKRKCTKHINSFKAPDLQITLYYT